MSGVTSASLPCHHCSLQSSATSCAGCGPAPTRRQLLAALTAVPAIARAASPQGSPGFQRSVESNRQQPVAVPLRVQPVLCFQLSRRREQTSYRPWGGLITAADVEAEKSRIGDEVRTLVARAEFPVEMLPLATASHAEEATKIADGNYDVALLYAASGPLESLEILTKRSPQTLIFLRHRSGPAYLWYEIIHPRFLRKTVDAYGEPNATIDDVVVDSQEDLRGRLQSLYALKNTMGKRVVALGGAGGWGKGGEDAAEISRNLWKLDIQPVAYEELGQRIVRARGDSARVALSRAKASDYLKRKGVTLETSRPAVENAFLLTEVFQDLLDDAQTDAFTINNCMSTIMPLSETTACLSLSLLNDAGYMAFCESDFVVIPSGILLRHLSGKPVFLNDPTLPHHGMVTLAHCTAPARMDGKNPEPVRLLTHFESDYGVAPKVEMAKGQRVTNLIPDFSSERWVAFTGEILDHPFLPICRSQIDVSIDGSTKILARDMKGFHWMTCYGDYLGQAEYALGKVGVEMQRI